MPLDLFRTRANLSYSSIYRENYDQGLDQKIGISGNFGEFNQYGYGLNYSKNDQ